MKLKYRLMWFDMPEYYGGNCGTVEVFNNPEEAYEKMIELEKVKTNDNMFYLIAIEKYN